MERVIINTHDLGGRISKTVHANYHKVSLANAVHTDGRATTMILEYVQNADKHH